MARATFESDMEEWEVLDKAREEWDFILDPKKDLFARELRVDPQETMDLNYFLCPNTPIADNQMVEKRKDDGYKDIEVAFSHAIINDSVEDELPGIPMTSPESNSTIPEPEPEPVLLLADEETECTDDEFIQENKLKNEGSIYAEKGAKEEFESRIWRWRVQGVGALCSIGVTAAATICVLLLGGRQRQRQQQQNQRMQFQIYADDKRIKQVVQQANLLNQVMSAARSIPMTNAQISFGGYYNGL